MVLSPGRRQSKMPILSRNVDKKSIETVFSIAICCPTGPIVEYVFDCHLPGVVLASENQLEDSFKKFTTERVNQGIEKTSNIVIG